MSSIKNSPNKYPLPPMFLVGTLIVCSVLDWLAPIGWDQVSGLMRSSGVVLLIVALGLFIWPLMTFRRFKANFHPNKAATHLLTSGPFSYSRNPIYLGNVLFVASFGLVFGSRWFLLGAVVLFFLLNELVIKREEQHLAANFTREWDAYIKRVRRWI